MLPGIWLGDWSVGVVVFNYDVLGEDWSVTPARTFPVTISAEPPYSYQSLLGPKIATTGGSQSEFDTQVHLVTTRRVVMPPGRSASCSNYDTRANLVTRYDYTAGQLTQLTLPAGNRYQLGYDEAGRVVSLRDPDGQTTTLSYDVANRLTTLTNPLGHTLQLGYDRRDNLLYGQDANGNLTQRQYDGNGNLVAQTNALNQTHSV